MSTPPTRQTGYRLTDRGRAVALVALCLAAALVGYLTAGWNWPGSL